SLPLTTRQGRFSQSRMVAGASPAATASSSRKSAATPVSAVAASPSSRRRHRPRCSSPDGAAAHDGLSSGCMLVGGGTGSACPVVALLGVGVAPHHMAVGRELHPGAAGISHLVAGQFVIDDDGV